MKKMTLKDYLGYAIGAIGDSTAYSFVISFFSFFMTTVAGVSPAVAGMIISIAIAWDAITDPVIGYMVDHSKNKLGKRRPWMVASLIPMGASIVLMFLKIDMMQMHKNLYYLILVLVFWTSYTAFNIPYYSFGSVLTDLENERVKIAAYRGMLGYVGIFCASSVSTYIVGKILEQGYTEGNAWFIAGILMAIIVVCTIFLMWNFTRGKEKTDEQIDVEKISMKSFFVNVFELIRMKPYFLVIISALFTNVYMTLFYSSLMYYVSYNMNLPEKAASIMFTAMNISSIVFIPFMTMAINKFSKKTVFVSCMVFSGMVMIISKYIAGANVQWGCVYVILVGVGTCAYWMCIFNFLYDVVDYDEFNKGTKRDGAIMSYYSFLLKLGGSAAAALQGILLQNSGFNTDLATQSQGTLSVIESLFTLIPGICMIIAGVVIIFTPLNDNRMELLRVALAKKKNGEEFSTKGFETLVYENNKFIGDLN